MTALTLTAVAAPALMALIIAALVTGLLKRSRYASLLLDRPNQRSLHVTPVPRLGGIGIVAGIAAAWVYAAPALDLHIACAFMLLAAISLIDDFRSVPVVVRMTVHLAAAYWAMAALLYDGFGIGATLAATLAATWMINLYNFMDGSDGLAGGMAVFGFGAYGVAALMAGDSALAAVNLAAAAAAAGFLLFNFPPATVFMGDVGAIPLGYLAAVSGVAGWLRGDWPLWLGAVVFSPFIVDATVTLAKRLLHGEKIWQAHRLHYYQRLVHSGWGHRKTALAEYALMSVCAAVALTGARAGVELQFVLVVAVMLLYAVLVIILERKLMAGVARG